MGILWWWIFMFVNSDSDKKQNKPVPDIDYNSPEYLQYAVSDAMDVSESLAMAKALKIFYEEWYPIQYETYCWNEEYIPKKFMLMWNIIHKPRNKQPIQLCQDAFTIYQWNNLYFVLTSVETPWNSNACLYNDIPTTITNFDRTSISWSFDPEAAWCKDYVHIKEFRVLR